ncbi:hypothetical protein GQ43DRAFT_383577 [Delitschia confertaspora ATCC 74209]|uniref:Pkinase-domain-containing protein n=1 Tax=Delitschia confertaspora ATCC 74209 TaxID=1513339 RepID=A0A9P4MTP4_9PLEO|nr:hypothetical protein GQ43DRAFT_383577 [Delitschia confertaspora ATCC 74209]
MANSISSHPQEYPLYTSAIVLPLFAFPAIILDIPPLIWHFSQRNIAAWSLMLWIIIQNLFVAINPFLWPRDNVYDWYNGAGLCDVEARISVGSVVALPCTIVCIMRKLAKVMDTRNISVVPPQNQRIKDNVLEVLWCWAFPGLMMLVYYIVQPVRYFIFSISGCLPAYDGSWMSVLMSWIWGPIITFVAAYYAVVLLYRLYRYRREFSRLMAARNTTKSRFLRLLIMSLTLIFVCLPYSAWILYKEIKTIKGGFSWSRVHGENWNTVIKVPTHGVVFWDTWGHVVIGYLGFFVFGTGRDAKELYGKFGLAVGLGHLFPKLWKTTHGSSSGSSTLRFKTSWFSVSSKTKSLFSSKGDSMTETTVVDESTLSSSVTPILPIRTTTNETSNSNRPNQPKPSLLQHMLNLLSHHPQQDQPSMLPLHSYSPTTPTKAHYKSSFDTSEISPSSGTFTPTASLVPVQPLVEAHAWAATDASMQLREHMHSGRVRVMREVRQETQTTPGDEKKESTHSALETQDVIEIRAHEEFYVGRNSDVCRRHWSDPTISNKHLRVHCLMYEPGDATEIPPFVYATDVSTNGTYIKKDITHGTGLPRHIRLTRKHGSYLLDDGDELQLSNSVTLIYRTLCSNEEDVLNTTQQREKKACGMLSKGMYFFASRYCITDRVLGVGGQGKVLAAIHRKTQRQVACKIIDLTYLQRQSQTEDLRSAEGTPIHKRWPTKLQRCFREFEIVKDLNHPNIITIEKVFRSPNNVYLFEELITGGDLFSYLEFHGGSLDDVETAVIVRQILMGTKYLHDHNVVHRDLKPDNILMTSLDDGARIVITDFGNARFLPQVTGSTPRSAPPRRRMFTLVGTLEYAAPEIHKVNKTIPEEKGYSASVDMWSIGCITASMLSGEHLFVNRNSVFERDPKHVILQLSSACDLSALDDQTDPRWNKVGQRPKAFIKELLVLEEHDRLTAGEALEHPWFSNKHYAAEYDALYKRAIKDWRPRPKIFKLVESISDVAPETLDNVVVSQYFNIAASQYMQRNTRLPRISEEYEESNDGEQIPSQNLWVGDEPTLGSHLLLPPSDVFYDSMGQLSLNKEPEGLRISNHSRSYNSTRYDQSMSQDGHSPELGYLRLQTSHCQRQPSNAEQQSDVVRETPIKSLKRRLPSVIETPGTGLVYNQVSQEAASSWVSAKFFAAEVSKRRKLDQKAE